MNVIRAGNYLRIAPRFCTLEIARFSSYTLTNPRFPSFFEDDDSGSAIYQHKLKFQRPTTIHWKPHLLNSVHFIGSVYRSPELVHAGDGRLQVHASLRVRDASDPKRSFRIETMMFGKIAALCVRYLKADDYIYVSGKLKSYPKADEYGNLRFYYRVNVKELSYVTQYGEEARKEKSEQRQLDEAQAKGQKYTSRLHLWQVFFASPEEWWDNRKGKRNPGSPDFRHKDTGEALWLSHNDPPWVKRQLELLDTTLGKTCDEYVPSRSGISHWVYDV